MAGVEDQKPEMTDEEICRLIKNAGKIPVERDSIYNHIKIFNWILIPFHGFVVLNFAFCYICDEIFFNLYPYIILDMNFLSFLFSKTFLKNLLIAISIGLVLIISVFIWLKSFYSSRAKHYRAGSHRLTPTEVKIITDSKISDTNDRLHFL